jgi:hypothetical protein
MASMEALPFFGGFITFFVTVPTDYAPATAIINRVVVSYGEMQKLIVEVMRFD